MAILRPTWLKSDNAKKYWATLKPLITPINKETVAVLCQVYSDYLDTIGATDRQSQMRQKSLLEIFCKLSKELNIIGAKLKAELKPAEYQPSLVDLLKGQNSIAKKNADDSKKT